MRLRMAIITLFMLAAVLFTSISASAQTASQACTQAAKSPAGVKSLIHCAAPRLGVSTDHAMYIAWRESRYRPREHNRSSTACGVYQFVRGTWNEVVRSYLYGHALGPVDCENGRMNVFLALRYVSHNGWGPWGG
jgi:soluble lytic murein transglycosylase-like protein